MTAFQKLIDHLDGRDVRYELNSDQMAAYFFLSGDAAQYQTAAQIEDDGELFHVFGYVPNRIPVGAGRDIAEAVCRANLGLRVGKFEFDVEDGSIRFHIGQFLQEGDLDDEMISRSVGWMLAILDRYVPAFLSVIYGNETPLDAVRFVEAGLNFPDVADEPDDDGDELPEGGDWLV